MTPEEQELQNEFNTLFEEHVKLTGRIEEIKKRCNEIMEFLDPEIFEKTTEEMKEMSEELTKEIKLKKFAKSLR